MGRGKKIIQYIKNPYKFINYLGVKGKLNFIPDDIYLKLIYRARVGKKLNLKNPQTLTEKMQWQKLYDRKEIYHNYVDKFLVREIIKKKLGEEYLIPLIKVYDNQEQIDWDELPEKFVLKATHTSGDVIVCDDKSKLDINKSKEIISRWFKRDYYPVSREWPYKGLKPRVVCEEFLSENGNVPLDYKIMCFNGKPETIEVNKGRFINHTIEIYDTEWNKLNVYTDDYGFVDTLTPKPDKLDEILCVARRLSEGLMQCRIDLYYVNDRIYFSEITFFSGAGFDSYKPESFDKYLSDKFIIPERI